MRRKFISYLRDEEAGANISWGAIFAGVATFMAVLITLSFIGSALGFGIFDPTSSEPLEGVMASIGIWTIISLVLSFIAGGFVAGLAAQRIGLLHGFVTWATSVLLIFLLVTYTSLSAISTLGRGIGNVTSSLASGAGNALSQGGKLVGSGAESLADQIDLSINTDELNQDLEKVLKDTDVPELQPNYLQGQLEAAGSEIKEAAKQFALNPDQGEAIVQKTTESLKSRAQTIGQAADRDAIKNAVAKNSELTPEESDQVVDNIYNGLQKASKEAEEKLNQASVQITKLQAQTEETIEDAREGAEEVTNTTATASVLTFIGLILGMILSSGFGLLGNQIGSDPKVKKEA